METLAKVKINITLDEELLGRIDEYSEDNYMNRSSLITMATTRFLNEAEVIKTVKEISYCFKKIVDSGKVDEETKRQLESFEFFARCLGEQ